tara:strand:+ start:6271 stop:6834 length:564 start_codon:yes stop_codon:yes gene_type:complete
MDIDESWIEEIFDKTPKLIVRDDCTHRVRISDTAPLEKGSFGFYLVRPDREDIIEVHDLIIHTCPDDLNTRFRGVAGIISDMECVENRQLYKNLNSSQHDMNEFNRFASISRHVQFIIRFNASDRYYQHIINPEAADTKKYLAYRFSKERNRFQLEFTNLRLYYMGIVGTVAIVKLVTDQFALLESV